MKIPFVRNRSVDLFRVVAAFGVVFLHLPSDSVAAYEVRSLFWPVCVPFFYTTSLVYFVSGFKNGIEAGKILKKTKQRLVIPFISWTVIYGGLILVKKFLSGTATEISWWRVLFYGESSVQLYFIPTLLLFQALILGIILIYKESGNARLAGGAIVALAMLYLLWGDYNNCYGVAYTGQIAGITLFIVAAFAMQSLLMNIVFRPLFFIMGIVGVLGAVILTYLKQPLLFLEYPLVFPIGGIGLLLVAFAAPIQLNAKIIDTGASASYGIYLCHILFLEFLELLLKKIMPDLKYFLGVKLIITALLFLISFLCTEVVRRNRHLKSLLLGE